VALRFLPPVLLLTGCVSSGTGQLLDRTYEAAAVGERAPRTPRESAQGADDVGLSSEEAVTREAVAQSPELAVLAHQARALVHAGRAEGSLPPAELALEVWNLPLERPYSLNEADMYMVELRQRFPAAGSLDARARALAEEAQALLLELSGQERRVAEEAALAYADYVQAVAEGRIQERQVALLERMREVVRARFTTGGSVLADAARLEVELSRARRALARSSGEGARARAELNALLRRPADAALPEPPQAPPTTVRLSTEELVARAEESQGSLLSSAARVRAAEARQRAARAEARVPEFMAGLGYWQDPSMRPGFGITTSMSLPWFWGPGRHRVAQSEEEVLAEEAVGDESRLEARTAVLTAKASLDAIEEQLRVLSGQTLPATQRSLDALSVTLSSGSGSLLDWVDVSRSLLDLELEVAALHGELRRSVASLERAVGTALPRAALELEAKP